MKKLIVLWFKKRAWHFTGMLPKKLAKVLFVAAPCQHSFLEFLVSMAVLKITKVPAKIILDKQAVRPWKRRFLAQFKEIQFMDYGAMDTWVNIAQQYKNHERLALIICPLKANLSQSQFVSDQWYYLCKEQRLPIAMIAIDEQKRVLRFHGHFLAGKSAKRDLNFIQAYFKPFFDPTIFR